MVQWLKGCAAPREFGNTCNSRFQGWTPVASAGTSTHMYISTYRHTQIIKHLSKTTLLMKWWWQYNERGCLRTWFYFCWAWSELGKTLQSFLPLFTMKYLIITGVGQGGVWVEASGALPIFTGDTLPSFSCLPSDHTVWPEIWSSLLLEVSYTNNNWDALKPMNNPMLRPTEHYAF